MAAASNTEIIGRHLTAMQVGLLLPQCAKETGLDMRLSCISRLMTTITAVWLGQSDEVSVINASLFLEIHKKITFTTYILEAQTEPNLMLLLTTSAGEQRSLFPEQLQRHENSTPTWTSYDSHRTLYR